MTRVMMAVASFAVVASAGVVGVSAELGSASLGNLMQDLLGNIAPNLVDCGGTGNVPMGNVAFLAAATDSAEESLLHGAQVVPMSRSLMGPATTKACAGESQDFSLFEGMVFGLDAASVVANSGNFGGAACNGTLSSSCTANTSVGLVMNKTVTLPGGGTYSFTSWKDVLRVLYAGMSTPGDNNLTHRNCGSPERRALADNWALLFQGTCPTGSCSAVGDPGAGNNNASFRPANGIKHAFRLNDQAGATELFVRVLNLPPIVQGENTSPFCNVGTKGPAYVTPLLPPPPTLKFAQGPADPNTPALPAGRFNNISPPATIAFIPANNQTTPLRTLGPDWTDVQDRDVIRRYCDGTGLAGTNSENVCSARGDLGLVLPIWDSPAEFSSTPCSNGSFFRFGAVNINICSGSPNCYDVCPDGVPATDTGECEAPALDSGDPRCLNSRGNYDSVDTNNVQVDGRVYNLHVRTQGGGYALVPRASGLPSPIKSSLNVPMVGAYYRIHQANSFATQGGGPALCTLASATDQIGCLVQASPCSIGYARRDAKGIAVNGVQNAVALKVNGVDVGVQCIQNLISSNSYPAVGATYPLSARLYANTELSFEGTTGSLSKWATCLSRRSVVDTFIDRWGFVELNTPDATHPVRQVYCEDFNESNAFDADPSVPGPWNCTGGPTNHNRCKDHTNVSLPWHNCQEKDDPTTCH